MSDSQNFPIERHGRHVAIVRIASRPLGVLGVDVRRELLGVLEGIEADTSIRAVVLTGSGTAFSVGANIREFQQDVAWLREAERVECAVNDRIETLRCPVIAAINGHAYGAGLVLATACDIRLAAQSARLGVPEVTLGGLASGTGTQRLPQLIGRGAALMLLLTGRILTAGEALGMKLVDGVSPDDRLLDDALAMADAIAASPPPAVAATKASVVAGLRHGREVGLAKELDAAIELGLSPDALEGQKAFLEKRPPRFPSLED